MVKELVAHLSDLHLSGRDRNVRAFIGGIGRRANAEVRAKKASAAIARVRASGAAHLIITGDLTETGRIDEYEVLAEVLQSSGMPAERITLVPGNHDVYDSADAWTRALEGPLAPYASTSAHRGAQVVERGPFAIVPIDTTMHQTVLRSAGILRIETVNELVSTLREPAFARHARVIAMHHPPLVSTSRMWHRQDGLQGAEALPAALAEAPPTTLLHGHVHRDATQPLGRHVVASITATVEDPPDAPRFALYRVAEDAMGAPRLCRI